MPWQGNADILIDRFDVRAHLDYIPEVQNDENTYPEVSTTILKKKNNLISNANIHKSVHFPFFA